MAISYFKSIYKLQHEEIELYKRKLGFGKNFKGGAGADLLDALNIVTDEGYSGLIFSSGAKGYLPDKFFIESLKQYKRSKHVIIAAVSYPWLRKGTNGAHAVIIVDGNENEIIYHDPALEHGAFQSAEKNKFMRACFMFNYKLSRFQGINNMLAVWEEDIDIDLDKDKRKVTPKSKQFFQSSFIHKRENEFQPLLNIDSVDHKRAGKTLIENGPKRILVAINSEKNTNPGIESGLYFSKKFNAKLDILYIHSDSNQEIQEVKAPKLSSCHFHFVSGKLEPTIKKAINNFNPELLVVGAYCANTASYLAMNHTVPIWIEKGHDYLKQNKWDTIIVPIDTSAFSHLSLLESIYLAKKFGGSIVVLHVETNHHKTDFKKILKHINWQGVSYKFLSRKGDVTEEILRVEKTIKSSLIVIGTMGEGHVMDDDPNRSITNELINQAQTSLYVVHPKPRLNRN